MSMENVTEETLAQIAKAQTTGILESTGIYSYDLSGLVTLIPVVTPFRDIVPRKQSPDGNPFAVWRAIMNLTDSQPDPSMGFDYAANETVFLEQDFQARYKPTGLAGLVTQDAFDLARGYGDPYAIATFNVLNQVLIADDRKLMGAQSFALAQPASVTVIGGAASSGSLSGTIHIGVAARTGSGYYYGSGNSQGQTGVSTSVSSQSVIATAAPVRGAVAYDWFYGGTAGTTYYYLTTTTTNTLTVTAAITSNNALPSVSQAPDLSTVWQGVAGGIPTLNTSADNGSANANDYDGFLANLAGSYNGTGQWVTPGTGGSTANPSIWNSLGGNVLTLTGGTVTEIEEYLFLPLWNQVKCSPTAIMVNAAQAQEIANLILGQYSATTFLNTDAAGRVSVTAGGRIGEIVNAPAGGVTVPIEVHVSLPPGTIVARTDRVPFPQANITSVLEYRNLRDTAQFDYGISRVANTSGGGPRKEFEIRSIGAFLNRAPVAMAVLSNVA